MHEELECWHAFDSCSCSANTSLGSLTVLISLCQLPRFDTRIIESFSLIHEDFNWRIQYSITQFIVFPMSQQLEFHENVRCNAIPV